MKGFNTPCLVCGVLVRGATKCPKHQAEANNSRANSLERLAIKKQRYNAEYQKVSRQIRAAARFGTVECYICGVIMTATDEIQVDHVYPALGNQSPLLPVHGRCNRSKGNKTPEEL